MPTVDIKEDYALRPNVLLGVFRNYSPGMSQNLVSVLTCISASNFTLANDTKGSATWVCFSGCDSRGLPMNGTVAGLG